MNTIAPLCARLAFLACHHIVKDDLRNYMGNLQTLQSLHCRVFVSDQSLGIS